MYVWVCMYRYICIFLRSDFSSLSFLFFSVYLILALLFSLEVDVQTLKPPSARPRTMRVGYNKKIKIYIYIYIYIQCSGYILTHSNENPTTRIHS